MARPGQPLIGLVVAEADAVGPNEKYRGAGQAHAQNPGQNPEGPRQAEAFLPYHNCRFGLIAESYSVQDTNNN